MECDSHAMMNSPPSTQCLSSTGASREPYRTVSGCCGTGDERGVERELQAEQLTLLRLFSTIWSDSVGTAGDAVDTGALDRTSGALVAHDCTPALDGLALDANRCGGGRKSSSNTGEPGESSVDWCERLEPNASLNVHQVARISGGTCVRRLGSSGVAVLVAVFVALFC